MSKYTVFIKKKVLREIERIEKKHRKLILEKIHSLSAEPLSKDVRKLFMYDDVFRIRQGDYRIIYSIDSESNIIRVLRVRHRKDAYRGI